ncbi:MAG: hypothetical protein ACFFCQ_11225 [Promethearchaeota archaeon]
MPICPKCQGYVIKFPCPVCEQQSEESKSLSTEIHDATETSEEDKPSKTRASEDHVSFPEPANISFPRYDINLHLEGKTVTAVDRTTDEVLKSYEAPKNLIVDNIEEVNYYNLKLHGLDKKAYEVHLRALELEDSVSTEAGSIFSIQYESSLSLGAYYGTQGWGLFQVTDNKIKIIFSRVMKEITTGFLTKFNEQLIFFLGFSDGSTKAIELQWSPDKKDHIEKKDLWKVEVDSETTTVKLIDENLVSSHKDGYIRIRELNRGRLLKEVQITDEGILCFENNEKYWWIGTTNGYVFALNPLTWRLGWETKLSEYDIKGVNIFSNAVCFTDNEKSVYLLTLEPGKILRTIESKRGVTSKGVQLKNWVIVAGAAAIVVFEENRYFETHTVGDKPIRALCSHPQGIMIGNDNGELFLWSYPSLKIIES